jgi:hypothetical protein
MNKLIKDIAEAVANYYRPSGVPKDYADSAVKEHAGKLYPIIEVEMMKAKIKAKERIIKLEGALITIADFAVGNGDVCEIIAKRAREALKP